MTTATNHPVVCFGETLWDVLPTGKQAGGAPMNVAYHLQQLGKHPAVISRIGYDELGRELIKTLDEKGICTEYFQVDCDKPTSVVKAEQKQGNEMVYTIVEDVAWDYIAFSDELASLVSSADYFVFGSLATRAAHSCNTLLKLLPLAKRKVLDINLRPPFYSRRVVEMLLGHANIVKMNEHELELIASWFSDASTDTSRMKLLQERFALDTIIVTRGADGALVYHNHTLYSCTGIPVQVKDTVGSGDSFLAAMLAKIMEGANMNAALQFANQLAAFVTTQSGACPAYDAKAFESGQSDRLSASANYRFDSAAHSL